MSDAEESNAALGTRLVSDHFPEECKSSRAQCRARIVSSRASRGWKPQAGALSRATARSRWRVLGREEEDDHGRVVYSPTPR
eukprot:3658066-Pyramimonas_sp.AAC.1